MKKLILKSIDTVIKANFMVAVLLIIAMSLSVMTNNTTLLAEDGMDLELYGALANNLHLIFIYIAVAEINLVYYSCTRKKQPILVWVGFFYILMIGGLEFYGQINQVPISADYKLFFLYQGIAHISFGSCYLFKLFYLGSAKTL